MCRIASDRAVSTSSTALPWAIRSAVKRALALERATFNSTSSESSTACLPWSPSNGKRANSVKRGMRGCSFSVPLGSIATAFDLTNAIRRTFTSACTLAISTDKSWPRYLTETNRVLLCDIGCKTSLAMASRACCTAAEVIVSL